MHASPLRPGPTYSGQTLSERPTVTTFIKPTEISIGGAHTLPREYFTSPDVYAARAGADLLPSGGSASAARTASPTRATTSPSRSGRKTSSSCTTASGGYQAYYNVCRHRGTRLCEEHTGRFSETIQCPYHAWTYGLDGRLIGAPSTADIENFDKADWPLHPVAVATWEGFLFINLADDPEPFDTGLGAAAGPVQPVQPAQPARCTGPSSTTSGLQLEAAVPELLASATTAGRSTRRSPSSPRPPAARTTSPRGRSPAGSWC